jgi:hypothetical protein
MAWEDERELIRYRVEQLEVALVAYQDKQREVHDASFSKIRQLERLKTRAWALSGACGFLAAVVYRLLETHK